MKSKGRLLSRSQKRCSTSELANGHEVLARVSGNIRTNFIKILPGDRVLVELSPYGLGRGRITYRFK